MEENREIKNSGFGLRDFYIGIYKWMTMGVLVSGIFAYIATQTTYLSFVFANPIYFYAIVGIEIALMLGIQFMIKKLSPQVAIMLFMVYAALNGITLAGFFAMYDVSSILSVFIGAVILFVTLAVLGYTTKVNLSSWGTYLAVSTWVIFITSILNAFVFQSNMLDMIVSAVALLVFGALTIYDNQAYKNIFYSVEGNDEEEQRYTALGALHMYINFIMIFTNLLRFLGNND
ncbi:hypothetical protein CSB11_03115 [Candidatus Campbellbacteria bacterium]|nr:MAG: hypothetical protein CSB11_03115 [Candidatus Campbellbacteria bacterium]